jgi:cytidylate kinase
MSVEDARAQILARKAHETERFKRVYGVDPHDKTNFDLVIDTSTLTLNECVAKIIAALPKEN